ncbi:agmatinase [Aliidiomarina haloalkalitolerans]|uniref:Agmatinase n=1 Tax=Aliidiomarina haloalkalitolerans TaxID=859059 RepID=A0A432VU17_9GAMM|nr:agmatinase [Aliidiomarina haloalkalitolerans]MCL4409476.1 agmatinase [Gammaproteobacteria bacterium]RUO19933.1 agmatinase [Aliidiomarina haloalkalitolerans]
MAKTFPIPVHLDEPVRAYFGAELATSIESNRSYVIGFGFDGTACFRKGTRYGPDGLRAVSEDIESYSPYLDLDLEDHEFFDLGNLQLGESTDVESQWRHASDDFNKIFGEIDLAAEGVKVMTLGGEHSISYAPIVKYLNQYPDLVLVHLDAHADLRDGFTGFHYSHASIIRRALDHFGPNHELIQYGIRSGTREEYQYMREHKTVRTSRKDFLDSIAAIPADRPIYLTLDLDYFDPSFLPGTGTPEPGGEDFHSFVSLIKLLRERNLVGCDVVELSPQIDPTGNSDVFAAKIVRELLLVLEDCRK